MLHSVNSLKSYRLGAVDGEIGRVADLYFDSHEWTARYLVVNTGAWLFGKQVLLPAKTLGGVDVADTSIRVNLTLAKIKASPESDTKPPVSRRDDISRHEYYGVESEISPWISLHTPALAALDRNTLTSSMEIPHGDTRPTGIEADQFNLRSVHDVIGHTVQGTDREIGTVGDFLVDDADWSIRYFVVNTAIWFGQDVALPTTAIREVSWDNRSVFINLTREQVKTAPAYDVTDLSYGELDRQMTAHFSQ